MGSNPSKDENGTPQDIVPRDEKLFNKIIRRLLDLGIIVLNVSTFFAVPMFRGTIDVAGTILQLILRYFMNRGRIALDRINQQQNSNNSVVSIVFEEIVEYGVMLYDFVLNILSRVITFLNDLIKMAQNTASSFINNFRNNHHNSIL